MRAYLAELGGTFGLVLVGAGSITLELPHFWISFCFGAIVTAMILCFGKVSGAHINPAVSIAFFIRDGDKKVLNFIPFQLMGALLASLFIQFLMPAAYNYGETLPAGSISQAFIVEVVITFILMLVIVLIILSGRLWLIAFVVGFTVFLAAYFAGPYTGASMNPARSFGPAIVSGTAGILWLYFAAPILGAALAVPAGRFLVRIVTQ